MIADFSVLEPNSYTKLYRVTDVETGDVLFDRMEQDIEKAFANGKQTAWAYMSLHKEEAESGAEMVTFRQEDGAFCRAVWNKPQKKTSRRWRRWTYFREVAKLPEEQQIAVIKILPYVKRDGTIVTDRGRAMDAQAIRGLFFMGKNKANRVWNGLLENGVLEPKEKGWMIAEKYCQR